MMTGQREASGNGRGGGSGRSRVLGRVLLTVSLLLGALVGGTGVAQAYPSMMLPFAAGQTWYVCQGYNGSITHPGQPWLDVTTYSGRGSSGCYGGENAAAGGQIVSPADGTATTWDAAHGGVCVTFDGGGSFIVYHLLNRVGNGRVARGQQLGTVAPAGQALNGGYAHAHLEMHSGGCGSAMVPFSGGARFECAPDMTYSGQVNQWAGQALTRNCDPQSGSPIGHVDDIRGLTGGGVWIRGWVMDPDVKTQPTSLHVYLDGPAGSGAPGKNLGLANFDRPDVAAAYPGSSADHGFNSGFMGVAPGNHTLYVYGINVDGTAGSNVLLGQVAVSVPGTAAGSPLGNGDAATGAIAASKVAGWAFDPDTPQTAVEIHAYVDGAAGTGARGLSLGRASTSRPDVAKAYPAAGPNHGFDTAVTGLSPGPHTIFLYAINAAGGGENPLIGIMTATSPSGSPVGFLDGVRDAGAAIRITGWAVDPDLATKGLEIHAYVNGPAGDSKARGVNLGYATVARPDVAKVHPGAGPAHGFDVTIKEPALGTHVVYVYAIDAKAPGNNVLLGSKTVTVTEPKVPVAPPVEQPTSSDSLGSVQRLRAKRLGRSAVVVRWQHVPGHTAYRVRILKPSKRAWVSTTKNHLRVATKAKRIRVAVRAVSQAGQGPVVRRTVRVAARSR